MLEVIRLLCPFPTMGGDGIVRDGLELEHPKICQKCHTRDCLSHLQQQPAADLTHAVCPKGMSVVLCRFPEGDVLCNGIIVKTQNSKCPPDIRKQNQMQKVGWDKITAWYENVSQALPVLEEASHKQAQESIHGLHDVKTAVSLVTRNAEGIIATLPGETDEERIENAPSELKALLKSVQLLHTRLSASSILANPEAASHGQKHPTPIHKVCFKMVRLFEELAAKRKVRIRMTGTSFSTPRCYDSFETIPLVLIDNAVKYSDEGGEIIVAVKDAPNHVALKVESHGPIIHESMWKAIFERGVRGPNSHRLVSRGSGLGLYIAGIVAAAHGCEIRYECLSVDRNGKTGKNAFCCEIPLRE
jgi:K+-sensing histidine kinase KdpD